MTFKGTGLQFVGKNRCKFKKEKCPNKSRRKIEPVTTKLNNLKGALGKCPVYLIRSITLSVKTIV